MTDSKIKKSMECCIGYKECSKCFFNSGAAGTECISECMSEALDFINRLQAENERFKEHCSKCGEKTTKTILNLQELLGTAKAEAYKEFAERLKDKIRDVAKIEFQSGYYYLISEPFVDNIVEEMVGDVL